MPESLKNAGFRVNRFLDIRFGSRRSNLQRLKRLREDSRLERQYLEQKIKQVKGTLPGLEAEVDKAKEKFVGFLSNHQNRLGGLTPEQLVQFMEKDFMGKTNPNDTVGSIEKARVARSLEENPIQAYFPHRMYFFAELKKLRVAERKLSGLQAEFRIIYAEYRRMRLDV